MVLSKMAKPSQRTPKGTGKSATTLDDHICTNNLEDLVSRPLSKKISRSAVCKYPVRSKIPPSLEKEQPCPNRQAL